MKLVNKDTILKEYNTLEIKADHYSRTDWDRYIEIKEKLKYLDLLLLDIYNDENDKFLTNIQYQFARLTD